MSEKMIPLDVPQIYVSEAYAMGAVFNRGTKAWEVPEYDLETFAHLDRNQMTDSQKADVQLEIADALGRRQYLDVPYESKDQAKTLGARYDGEAKAWYVEKGRDLKQFSEIDRNQWSQDKKQDYQKKLDDAKESKRANWKPMDIMYEDKIEAAKLGGHYNKVAKRWEAHNEDALKKFAHIDLNQMSAEQRKQHVAQNLERREANAVREEHKDEIAAKATPEMLGEQQAPQAGQSQSDANEHLFISLHAGYGGDLNGIKKALMDGADPNYVVDSKMNNTIGHVAAATGNYFTVKALSNAGTDFSRKDSNGMNGLMVASSLSMVGAAEAIIETGIDLEARDNAGRTAVMCEQNQHGSSGVTDLLIKKGVNLDAIDNDGRTAVIHMSASGNQTGLRALLKAGADPDISDKYGEKAIDYLQKKVVVKEEYIKNDMVAMLERSSEAKKQAENEMLGEQQAPQAGHGQPHDVSELHDAGISDGTKNDITIAIDNAIARMRSYQDDKGISPAKEHWTDDAVGFLEEARNEISAGDVDGAAFSVHCAVEVEQSYPKESQDICVNAMRDFDEAMVNEMGKATWQARKGDFIEDVGQDVGQGKAQAKVQEKTIKMSGHGG